MVGNGEAIRGYLILLNYRMSRNEELGFPRGKKRPSSAILHAT